MMIKDEGEGCVLARIRSIEGGFFLPQKILSIEELDPAYDDVMRKPQRCATVVSLMQWLYDLMSRLCLTN